jgi:ABC-type sugar transport system substrate-binding protein
MQSGPQLKSLPKVLIVLALAAFLVFAIAACGSSSSSSSSTTEASSESPPSEGSSAAYIEEAKTAVEEARKVPTKFEPPGPSFDAGGASGKTVYVIAAAVSVPFIAEVDEGITNGLKTEGVNTKVVDGQVNPARVTQFLEQAVAQHADLVINQTLPSKVVEGPMKKVKAAGIPVVQMFEQDPGPNSPEAEARGVDAQVSECSACAGKLQAQWAIAESEGNVDAVGIEQSAVEYGDIQKAAIEEAIGTCTECSVEFLDTVSALEWATKLPTLTATALKNQSVNFFFPFYDNMSTSMIPSINAAGAQSRVQIVTYNANGNMLEEVKKGSVAADMGESAEWLGWAAADQSLRILNGVEPTDKSTVPMRLFDSTNIESIDLSEPSGTWYGVDFEKGFEELWELG